MPMREEVTRSQVLSFMGRKYDMIYKGVSKLLPKKLTKCNAFCFCENIVITLISVEII